VNELPGHRLASTGCIVALSLAMWVVAGSHWPALAAEKLHRIGVLDPGGQATSAESVGAFRQALRELGYVEGRNLVIEYRSADGHTVRLLDLAGELVQHGVDVIVAGATPAALAARHVTGTVPIVMASSGDPMFAGLVASLARPGGNVTGLHGIVPPELASQRLRLLRELLPGLARVGVLLDSGDAYAGAMMKHLERSTAAMGIRIHRIAANRPERFEGEFEAALLAQIDALIVLDGVPTDIAMPQIVQFATMSRLPAMYGSRAFVDAGGLMSYGIDQRDLFRRAAGYVHRILAGARPADLPVEAPTRFELAINLKAARTLGLVIPPSLLQRADHLLR
jgi:putative ABC transport system substrate-binding protein